MKDKDQKWVTEDIASKDDTAKVQETFEEQINVETPKTTQFIHEVDQEIQRMMSKDDEKLNGVLILIQQILEIVRKNSSATFTAFKICNSVLNNADIVKYGITKMESAARQQKEVQNQMKTDFNLKYAEECDKRRNLEHELLNVQSDIKALKEKLNILPEELLGVV